MARVVAELGRPETPDETAARKAESSRIYRSSQTFRNLIAAILATLAIVAIVIFGVPRGTPVEAPRIDVAAEAAATSQALGRPVLAATVPDSWSINGARIESGTFDVWTVIYAPDQNRGYLRVEQAFDADDTWPVEVLSGERPTGSVEIDGISWDEYRIDNPQRAGNVSYALGTTAGPDRVLVFGNTSPELAAEVAATLTDGIDELREDARP